MTAGSQIFGSSCPSLRNLSGLKANGSGYSSSLWSIALYQASRWKKYTCLGCKCCSYHALKITMDPLGMWYPSYTSSSVVRWGTPETGLAVNFKEFKSRGIPNLLIGATGSHLEFNYEVVYHWEEQVTDLRTSLTSAAKYGKSFISPKSGSLPPTTRSSSCCAFIWTWGKQTMARKKVWIDETVVSDPAVRM